MTKHTKKEKAKFEFLGILFAVLAFAATVSLIYNWQIANESFPDGFLQPMHRIQNLDTYTNKEFGFNFKYNKNYEIDRSGSQANFFKHEANSLVSVSIPHSLYPKTNFGSAVMTVATQPGGLESSCLTSAKSVQDGAAAGTVYQTKIYRDFHDQTCYEASMTIGLANIGNFAPGTVAQVDPNDAWNLLWQILKTFRYN